MTTSKRRDEGKLSTEFGLWLREQPEIDSNLGYIASNLDYMWNNYKTGNFMLIEEKRHMIDIKIPSPQNALFVLIDSALKSSNLKSVYLGFYLIQFENTNPDDGKIFINYKLVSKEELIRFLKFELKLKSYY